MSSQFTNSDLSTIIDSIDSTNLANHLPEIKSAIADSQTHQLDDIEALSKLIEEHGNLLKITDSDLYKQITNILNPEKVYEGGRDTGISLG